MADLEVAAETALAKVTEFTADVEHAEELLGALEEKLAEVSTQVDSDWAAFQESVQSLLESAQGERQRVEEDAQEATVAVDHLEAAGGRLGSEASPDLESAGSELTALADQVQAGRSNLAALLGAAETSAQGLADRAKAVEQQLQQALLEARDLLQVEVLGELQALQTEVQQGFDAVHEAITVDCQTALADKLADWEDKLSEVREMIEQQGFEDAKTSVSETADEALESCRVNLQAAFDELQPVARTLAEGLESVAERTGEHAEEVAHKTGELEEELLATHTQLETMLGALKKVSERLASLTFMP